MGLGEYEIVLDSFEELEMLAEVIHSSTHPNSNHPEVN